MNRFNTECPVKLESNINNMQGSRYSDKWKGEVSVLFNKGRYFEMSVSNKKLRASIAQAIKSKIQYGFMLVDSKEKLQSLVSAFNRRGYFVKITLDWI